jgi:hypothetical protein
MALIAQSTIPSIEPYHWKSVQIVGGRFVDGIIFHPTEKGHCDCRTDMGGAYRRNGSTLQWEPLLDWISYEDHNLMGVESIALDPSDPNRVYLACGTYTLPEVPNGAILRSNDRGKTFLRTDVPFKMGAKKKTGDSLQIMWRLPFTPGTLKAISRTGGKEIITQESRTAGVPAKIVLEADRSTIAADGKDLSFVTVKVLDAQGTLVPHADNLIHFNISGAGKIVGVDNGLQTSLESFKKKEESIQRFVFSCSSVE